MLLTIPEPKIKLYDDGFSKHCKLGRKTEGAKLSKLIEDISTPMVVALDAPWGAGKSVFLKCWAGEHTHQFKATTLVYFDAFKEDYMDDPLIALIGAVADRISDLKDDDPKKALLSSAFEKVKIYAPALTKGVLKFGFNMLTANALREIEDHDASLWDDAIKAGADNVTPHIDAFWHSEVTRRTAIKGFRDSLADIANGDQKLVIIVDELDRCRPDYALSLLEIIKHFFDVPNVHFVLGVNLAELSNSVRARYGQQIQAEKYLQKFISITMPLIPKPSRYKNHKQMDYLEWVANEIGLYHTTKMEWLQDYIQYIDHHVHLSLRDVEKIATLAMVSPGPLSGDDTDYDIYTGLLFLSVLRPEFVEQARNGRLSTSELFEVFDLGKSPTSDHSRYRAHCVWKLVTHTPDKSYVIYLDDAFKKYFGGKDPKEKLRKVISETIDVFEIFI